VVRAVYYKLFPPQTPFQHWINGIYVVYLVFIHLGSGFAGEVEYLTLSTKENLAHLSLVEVATVTTDSLMVLIRYAI
jgi:hypothetical protein